MTAEPREPSIVQEAQQQPAAPPADAADAAAKYAAAQEAADQDPAVREAAATQRGPATEAAAPEGGATEEAATTTTAATTATAAASAGDGAAPTAEPQEAPSAEADAAHHVVERDLEELSARAEKAEEYLELAQRTKADFENYRKRAAREASLAQDRGIAKLAKELLPAIDNLDRAVQASSAFAQGSPEAAAADVESQLASGIKLVHADVLAALARVGIEPFSPAGEPFDPQVHEAVAQHPIEGAASGTVVEVYQQGYRLGETVLRPARVLVAA
jgi:molecular chaperone GrpE